MLDRVTGMQVFVRTQSTGSLSAAARALGLSPSMVTKHIDALEARLGVRLFQRSTRQLSLTDAGRRYLEACQRILPELEAADAAATAEQVEASGLLRVNAPVSFGSRYLAADLAAFAPHHPRLTVELGLNDRRVDLVEEGWDLTIRIGRLTDTVLIARRIASSGLVVCAAPSYLARRGRPAAIEDLAAYDCLTYSLAPLGDRWMFGAAPGRCVTVSGPVRANNGDALVSAAVAGLGIICQPAFLVADAVRAGRLVPLHFAAPPGPTLEIHTLHAPGRYVPAKVRALIDFLVARYRTSTAWDDVAKDLTPETFSPG